MSETGRGDNSRQIADIQAERVKQDARFGVQNHPATFWLALLVEEVGETAKEIVDAESFERMRAELVQVAAVALAWLEAMDRRSDELAGQ